MDEYHCVKILINNYTKFDSKVVTNEGKTMIKVSIGLDKL